jgi:hypothetical protein
MKTSLIETIADSFGSRKFIVATKKEMTVRSTHWTEKSFFALKQRTAEGTAARHTLSR